MITKYDPPPSIDHIHAFREGLSELHKEYAQQVELRKCLHDEHRCATDAHFAALGEHIKANESHIATLQQHVTELKELHERTRASELSARQRILTLEADLLRLEADSLKALENAKAQAKAEREVVEAALDAIQKKHGALVSSRWVRLGRFMRLVAPTLVTVALCSPLFGQTNQVRVLDGSGNPITSTTGALNVNISSGSSSGVQYAEGATAATATGTVAMGKNGTTIKSIQTDSSGNLLVVCQSGCGGVSSFTDNSPFTAGSTAINNTGGVYNDGLSAVTSGNASAFRITAYRGLHINLRNNSGVEIGTSSTPIRVDPTGTTPQPVTGTFWQATQPVSGTVTANAGTGTFAISAASLPLPSGASTSAKQPALGTAGSASTDVITVQGISGMTAVKVDGSAVTQPVSGTFWQTTQPVSIAATVATSSSQLPAALDGSGYLKVHEQGTVPVTGTFWQATQPVSGTVASTQSGTWTVSTDASGANGFAVPSKGLLVQGSDGTNSRSLSTTTAGVLKVDLSSTAANSTAVKVDGSAVTQPVSISGNQAVNVAQINGVTPLMGNGVTGTGSQRVTIASDNTAFTVNAAQSGTWTVQPGNTANTTPWLMTDSATSATGSAVPAKASYIGGNGSGNVTGIIACDNHAVLDMSTATTTQIIAASGSTKVYICSYVVQANGTTTATMKYGTGSNCGTGTGALGAAFDLTAQTGVARGSGIGMIAKTIASQAVCWTNSAAVNLHIEVTYTQF